MRLVCKDANSRSSRHAPSYRGVFGCHTALVLRRLRRLCEGTYRCSPTFVVTSATVANARQHVQDLLGELFYARSIDIPLLHGFVKFLTPIKLPYSLAAGDDKSMMRKARPNL